MTDPAAWPIRLSTTAFVAHPDHLDRAQQLYIQRLNAIPAEQARVHFHSDHPRPRAAEFELWQLRCTAVYEALGIDLPDPDLLELFEVHCILSVNPESEEEVAEKLFFADHSEPDPFPGSGDSSHLTTFVPGELWQPRPTPPVASAAPNPVPEPTPPPASATSWLATLHILAAPGEATALAADYSRLLAEVPDCLPGARMDSASPAPRQIDDDSITGPLWLADTRRAVADPTAVTAYPVARRLHRARLVIAAATDPAPLLPTPRLPGTWETEPLV